MIRRLGLCLSIVAMLACTATALQAAPIFYLSNMDLGTAAPGILDSTVDPGSSGQIGIFVNSDVRLSGVSLNLVAVGGGIQFTGASVNNPSSRWTFTESPTTTPAAVTSIGGGAIPFVSGNGIGPGGEAANGTSGYLLGTVNYTAGAAGSADLFLQVGLNTIADWDGGNPNVIFGPGSLETSGGTPGATDPLFDGRISVLSLVEPPVVTDYHDPTDLLNKVVNTTLEVTNTPVAWSDLGGFTYTPGFGATNPTGLDKLPSWDPVTGTFNWDTSGSTRGTYSWLVTATNAGGSDEGMISVDVTQVPEPAAFALLGLALVGFAGFRRK